jgi:dipeptidyl aminopeptidase/acylaminoacyl peptidase
MSRTFFVRTLVFSTLALASVVVFADATEAVYRLPDEGLVDLVDAPLPPRVQLSPDGGTLLVMDWRALTTVGELAEEELRLAGIRIKPAVHGRSRGAPTTGLSIVRLDGEGATVVSGLPDRPYLGNFSWSPGGERVAFTQTGESGIELWVLEIAKAAARRLTGPILNLTSGTSPAWIDDSGLVTTLVSEEPEAPSRPGIPSGPVIQENLGAESPARTYQDLLQDEHDAVLFEHYFTSQLARVDLDGTISPLGAPGMHFEVEPSPDGRYLLVETVHRPFSYLVPARRFPLSIEIWSIDGTLERQIHDRPLQESIPIARGSVAVGPRDAEWRADLASTLVWAEAQDGGDAGREAEIRDRLYALAAPFEGEPRELVALGLRYNEVMWASDDLALVYEWWWKSRRLRAWRIRPGDPAAEPQKIFDYSWQDRYNDPGEPLTGPNAYGRRALRTTGAAESIFLVGDGASPEGDRPFLDRLDLGSGKSERLFRSQAPFFEQPMDVLDDEGRRILTRREAVEQVPNYFVRSMESDEPVQLTDYPHPTPQLLGITKEIIRYQRQDELPLSATLYLPPGYKPEDGPLPMLMWAYPIEFKSADSAGQIDDSPYRFARVGWWSPLVWLSQGYAVLDDPKMPIIGEGEEEPNDSFREQLVSSARAAVEEVVRRGVAENGRIAIGGHSYGAFMTANLLAHSDLFAAGIARSGAYNRSLTPFGFQAEERTFWEAPEVYFTMSPFMHAEKVNEPILLIHGDSDNNSGTFPLQSERYYNALKGHGATARLVMLPLESHGYRGRESILHMLWETERWLEAYTSGESAAEEGSASGE